MFSVSTLCLRRNHRALWEELNLMLEISLLPNNGSKKSVNDSGPQQGHDNLVPDDGKEKFSFSADNRLEDDDLAQEED